MDGSSDAGPELAGRESHAAMESPQALIAPLGKGMSSEEVRLDDPRI